MRPNPEWEAKTRFLLGLATTELQEVEAQINRLKMKRLNLKVEMRGYHQALKRNKEQPN